MFELGKRRPDGKFNVWRWIEVRAGGPEWVIVHVVREFREGLIWIEDQVKTLKRSKSNGRPIVA